MKPRCFLHPTEKLKGLPVPLSEVDAFKHRRQLATLLRFHANIQKTLLLLVLGFLVGAIIWLCKNETAATTILVGKDTPDRKLEFLVDLNHAPKSEILHLPGVGGTLADRIIEYREQVGAFEHVEDLENIRGIGAKKREDAASYVYCAGK